MTTSKEPVTYQLKVTLKYSKPPIWRRLLVNGDVTLAQLHNILQIAMGWSDCHLHQFLINGIYYGTPDPEYRDDELNDERKMLLRKVTRKEKFKFAYQYDFGDFWEHDIVVEKITPASEDNNHVICIKGKGACPPEDCGGMWGYAHLLEALQNSDHPEHEELSEWIGDELDPTAFDIERVNRKLERLY